MSVYVGGVHSVHSSLEDESTSSTVQHDVYLGDEESCECEREHFIRIINSALYLVRAGSYQRSSSGDTYCRGIGDKGSELPVRDVRLSTLTRYLLLLTSLLCRENNRLGSTLERAALNSLATPDGKICYASTRILTPYTPKVVEPQSVTGDYHRYFLESVSPKIQECIRSSLILSPSLIVYAGR